MMARYCRVSDAGHAGEAECTVPSVRKPPKNESAGVVRGEAARPATGILLTRRAHAEERDASDRER